MLLNELFNQSLPWAWDKASSGDGEAYATFSTGDTPYIVSFVQHDNFDDPDTDLWDVEFVIDGLEYPNTVSVSNTGNAPLVFATVIDIIKTFVQEHKGITLVFSGKGPSRTKLYDRLTKRLSPNVKITHRGGSTSYRITT